MFHINVWLTAKDPANVSKLRDLLSQASELSRKEPGCARFEVYHSEMDETKFLLCEHWETKEAWEVHKTLEAFTTIYQPQVLPIVEREGHCCQQINPLKSS